MHVSLKMLLSPQRMEEDRQVHTPLDEEVDDVPINDGSPRSLLKIIAELVAGRPRNISVYQRKLPYLLVCSTSNGDTGNN